jgi:release factor glutamine methyltransferase
MRIATALALARELGVDRLDVQLLLAHQLQRPRTWLIAHDDAELAPDAEATLRHALIQRADGVPLAYLVGSREFHGLPFAVTPAVLVPRPDTEVLVDWALDVLPAERRAQVVDLGTGSGAIAVSLAHARQAWSLTATDVDATALAVAMDNAKSQSVQVEVLLGSWWQAVQGRRFDLAVSNPPYIAGDDPHLSTLQHEPQLALTPGGDGLEALRVLIAGAPRHLQRGSWLLLEHGHDQAEPVRALLQDAGFRDVQTRRDLSGHERCSGGRLPD